jgi:hypothetical protein
MGREWLTERASLVTQGRPVGDLTAPGQLPITMFWSTSYEECSLRKFRWQ